MGELVNLVNRLRTNGWKYTDIEEKLMKMGNTKEQAYNAIDAYVRETCGVRYDPN